MNVREYPYSSTKFSISYSSGSYGGVVMSRNSHGRTRTGSKVGSFRKNVELIATRARIREVTCRGVVVTSVALSRFGWKTVKKKIFEKNFFVKRNNWPIDRQHVTREITTTVIIIISIRCRRDNNVITRARGARRRGKRRGRTLRPKALTADTSSSVGRTHRTRYPVCRLRSAAANGTR